VRKKKTYDDIKQELDNLKEGIKKKKDCIKQSVNIVCFTFFLFCMIGFGFFIGFSFIFVETKSRTICYLTAIIFYLVATLLAASIDYSEDDKK